MMEREHFKMARTMLVAMKCFTPRDIVLALKYIEICIEILLNPDSLR